MVCGKCEAKNDDVELYCKKCGADLQIHFSGATPVLASGVEAGGEVAPKREEEIPAAVPTEVAEVAPEREGALLSSASLFSSPTEEPAAVTTPAETEVQREETEESAQPVSPPYPPYEVEAKAAETSEAGAAAAETTQEAKEAKPDAQPEKPPAWERFSQKDKEEKPAEKYVLSEDEGVSTSETDKAKKEEKEAEEPKPVKFDFEEEELEG